MKAIAVIPARLASTRLPGKMLREIAGEPLISHVYRGVRSCSMLADVIVATDSDEIFQHCRSVGFHVLMTSTSCRNGTERVHEMSNSISADMYINVQGDELLARAEHIQALLDLMKNLETPVGTLKVAAVAEDIANPHAVKVVTDGNGNALYFSRSTIPYDRDGTKPAYFKHLGFYAYRKDALDRYVSLPESPLEQSERLEQLRFLENGIPIRVAETSHDTIRIDAPEDLQKAAEILRAEK
ncbi:MAG TPA: 3-deoxy-manno-octulosonate cytidylyltransferase [Terriglobales bacterium]|nr:3-deoxy-manno-octulosonate cytidylyltransferase [Terriglobales bacterium]